MTIPAKLLLLWIAVPLLVWGLSRVSGARRLGEALAAGFQSIAHKRTLSVVLTGLLCIAGRLALLPVLPRPEPAVQDEFSYLLAGDTFASGRLTNPTHPLWVHFEAVHELSQPSYQSKYPPLQGLMLAAGQKLAGDPWLGVLLSAGLMCGALCWMLQGWVAPGWALAGALLALLQFGIFRYWTNSYWGGAMAAFGGALVLGAAARLLWPERSRLSASANGALLACGIAVLANSRPFEGLLFCAAVGIAMVSVYGRATGRLFSIRAMAPAALVLASTAGAMAFYNFRVTGDALTLPYQAHEKQYAVAAAFLFQPSRPVPEYHHKELKDFWAGWDVEVLRIHEAKPALYWTVQMASLVPFFLGIGPELLAILVALWAWRVREIRLALIATVLFFLPLFFAKAFPAHYVAPMTAVFLLAVTLALQRLGTKTRFLLACILLATAVEFALAIIHPPSDFILEQREFAAKRSAILSELRSLPGDHLVIVQYAPGHNVREGWIYNAADIDGSRVVWAHDMGALKNKELTGYYPARTVWRLQPDGGAPRLTRYDEAVD